MSWQLSSWKLVLTYSLLALSASTLHAQAPSGIQWRTDYNAARKEAEEKKMPMLIDFITQPCFHCDRMDKQTFADRRVTAAVNESFIPLKVNQITEENKETSLISRLQVDRFPTIMLASPDGTILHKQVGFQEAGALHELIQQTVASLTPTDATKDRYLAAVKAEAAGDYDRAINSLRYILVDPKVRPITKDAQALMDKIEKTAATRLALAKELQDNGKNVEALEAYTEVLRSFPSVPAGREAADRLTRLARADKDGAATQRTRRARDLMNQARDFYKSKDYILCFDRCEYILANFGDLPEGPEAHGLAGEIKNNPEWLRGAADLMVDRLGELWLALSDVHLKQGEVRNAQNYLQKVISVFPGSRMAESAQIRLNQLQGGNRKESLARP